MPCFDEQFKVKDIYVSTVLLAFSPMDVEFRLTIRRGHNIASRTLFSGIFMNTDWVSFFSITLISCRLEVLKRMSCYCEILIGYGQFNHNL